MSNHVLLFHVHVDIHVTTRFSSIPKDTEFTESKPTVMIGDMIAYNF